MSKKLDKERDINHLQHTIIKLRDELEKNIIEKDKGIQTVESNSQIGIRDLEKTIRELRKQNEKDRIGEEDRTGETLVTSFVSSLQ